MTVLVFSVSLAFGVSLRNEESVEYPFSSGAMLDTYYDSTLSSSDVAFWDQSTVSLITLSKGSALYSWFGHSAILVELPGQVGYVFDYGAFSFNQEDFFVNFAFGRLWFCCSTNYATYEFAAADDALRTVSKVTLPLSASDKKAIVNFLIANNRQENSTYLYHHYKDNCATRLRDIIDRATGGDFYAWASGIEGETYRQGASKALSQNPIVLWTLNLLQSGNIDKKNTLWEAMFLPSVLENAVSEYFGLEREFVVDHENDYKSYPEKSVSNIGFGIIFGLALGLVVILLGYFGRFKARDVFVLVVNIVFGLVGTVLFFMMFFTNHDVTFFNENLLFVNPLLVMVGIFAMKKSKKAVVLSNAILLSVVMLLILLKLFLSTVFIQQNADIIATMILWFGAVFSSYVRPRQ